MSSPSITVDDVARAASWIERLTPRLHAWLRLRVGRGMGPADADDFVQEVWLRVLGKRCDAGADPTEAPPDGYVFQVAKFVLLETLRRSRMVGRIRLADGRSTMVHAMEGVPAELTTLTRRIARREELDRFLDRIAELDELDRKICMLCGIEERTHQDVADELGMQRSAVSKRWTRLRDRIRTWQAPAGVFAAE